MNQRILIIGFLLLSTFISKSALVAGGDITYKHIDSLKYEVFITFYRDCRGQSASAPSEVYVRCSNNPNDSIAIQVSLFSISDVSMVCDTFSTICDPANAAFKGSGMEKQVYKGVFNLNDTTYDQLKSCCKLTIFAYLEQRHSSINTGPANTEFYNYAELDICKAPENSSPLITLMNRYQTFCSQTVQTNYGVIDTLDGDSLSFQWAEPLTSAVSSAAYTSSGYSYLYPYSFYYTSTTLPPYNNPSAPTPIGLYLNAETGDIVYSSTSCTEISPSVLEVKEWRKDTSGNYEEIGKIRVERTIFSSQAINNFVPKIKGTVDFTYETCVGETFCFDIESEDFIFLPTPPALPGHYDTVDMTWNGAISGASFEVDYTDTLAPVGRFCWTPTEDDLRSRPYQFAVEVNDNNCDFNATSSRSFKIRVTERLSASTSVDTAGCGLFDVSSQWDSLSGFIAAYEWQVLDTNLNQILSTDTARFNSSGLATSTSNKDSVLIKVPGKYIIRHIIRNVPYGCKTIYDHPVEASPNFAVLISGKDSTLCYGEEITLTSSVQSAVGPIEYYWQRGMTTYAQDTLSSLVAKTSNIGSDTVYTLFATDATGCTDFDSKRIQGIARPSTNYSYINETCTDSVKVNLNASVSSVLWSDGQSGTIATFKNSGIFRFVLTDNNGCVIEDSVQVKIYNKPEINIGDTSLCLGSSLDAGDHPTIYWSAGITTRYFFPTASSNYSLNITDTNGCSNSASFKVTVLQPPTITLIDLFELCSGDSLNLRSDLIINPSNTTGATESWSCYQCNGNDFSDFYVNLGTMQNPDYILDLTSAKYMLLNLGQDTLYLQYSFTDSNSCLNTDSTRVLVNGKPIGPTINKSGATLYSNFPNVMWYKDGQYLQGKDGDSLKAEDFGVYTARYVGIKGCLSEFSNQISRTSGIAVDLNSGLKVYPNPSTNNVTIMWDHGYINTDNIQLIDAKGRAVSIEIDSTGNSHTISWDGTAGIYILQFVDQYGERINFRLTNLH